MAGDATNTRVVMNFEVEPELHWMLGYPLALAMMLITAVAPFWWFKKKGWL